MPRFKIVVFAGDYCGPEVTKEAIKILRVIERAKEDIHFDFDEQLLGGASIDANGEPLTDKALAAANAADAVLLGAIGGPKWASSKVRPEEGLLKLRKQMSTFGNLRPCFFPSDCLLSSSPLKPDIARGTDFTVVRELTGGLYFGARQEASDANGQQAYDTEAYSRPEIERIARLAGHLAMQPTKQNAEKAEKAENAENAEKAEKAEKVENEKNAKKAPLPVWSLDKANVLATSRLWRKTVSEVMAAEFPRVQLGHHLIDSAAMLMVKKPRALNGIVLTSNLFGDIITDEASVIPGSLGLLPSASLGAVPDGQRRVNGIYEPIHGSAPDIAGTDTVNPVAAILSVAMMLRYSLCMPDVADAVGTAVKAALESGTTTRDVAGGEASTTEMGDAVARELRGLLG